MARLGKRPIVIPEGVKVNIKDGTIEVQGPKGTLERSVFSGLSVLLDNNQIFLKNEISDDNRKLYRKTDAFQGLLKTLIENMINGVNKEFEKILEIHGVGHRVELKEKVLILTIGFSHPVEITIPDDISAEVAKKTIIYVRGINKEHVGSFAAKIRDIYPPEPYKGKGIRYRGEYVRQKVGKTAVGGAK